MSEKKVLYATIRENEFREIIEGSIAKHRHWKGIGMYQSLEEAAKEARWLMIDKSRGEKRYNPVICEFHFPISVLLQLARDKILVAPTWWLVMNHLIDPCIIDPEDLKMLERFYPTASFDFYKILLAEYEITKAYSFSDCGEIREIYQLR